jgi:hypothetical protein
MHHALMFGLLIAIFFMMAYEGTCLYPEHFSSDEAIQNLSSLYNSDTLTVTNLNVTGKQINMGNRPEIISKDRMHLSTDADIYLLPKNGVVIGKEWGGNGSLHVQGNVRVDGNISSPIIDDHTDKINNLYNLVNNLKDSVATKKLKVGSWNFIETPSNEDQKLTDLIIRNDDNQGGLSIRPRGSIEVSTYRGDSRNVYNWCRQNGDGKCGWWG